MTDKERLRKAFEDGSTVIGFSDMGVTMQYDDFDSWYNEFIKNEG